MSNVLAKQSSKLERYSDAFKFYFKQNQKNKKAANLLLISQTLSAHV